MIWSQRFVGLFLCDNIETGQEGIWIEGILGWMDKGKKKRFSILAPFF